MGASASDELWGEAVAAAYDDRCGAFGDPVVIARTVDVLAEFAGEGPALELAIGTGRIGLPLRERGVDVHGIESSEAMASRLRSKPGGADLPVTIGDMATTRIDSLLSSCTLVFLVFNTITNLLTQDEQVACFQNAADHLAPDGRFVVETFVPDLHRVRPEDPYVPFDVSPTHLGIDEYDLVRQRLTSHHTYFTDGRVDRYDSEHRYASPAEYDLMARLAGLRLDARWGDWDRTAINAESRSHVSVWRRSA